MVRTMSVESRACARNATEASRSPPKSPTGSARRGVPFAQAHEITGALVRRCEERDIELAQVTDDDLAAVDARLTPESRAA